MSSRSVIPPVGSEFNPYKRFNGNLIPEQLSRAKEIPPGAKLVYGRLLRFAGENGKCFPSVGLLAYEVGLSVNQVGRYLKLLEGIGFIRRVHRFCEHGKTSNLYIFLWHYIFNEGG